MDKKVAGIVKKVMGDGEKIAPVKSLKLKVKFQKAKKPSRSQLNKAAEKKFFGK